MEKTIYLNVADEINKIDFTFDLTPEILNKVRSKKHNLSMSELVGMVHKCFKKRDFQKGSMVFAHYLLKTESWKLAKDLELNCFNYSLQEGNGYGFIQALFITEASSHEQAHKLITP